MNIKDDLRNYYDHLYRNPIKLNPAYLIYDSLRVGRIKQLAEKSIGPCLIIGCGSRKDLDTVPPHIQDIFAFDLSWEAVRNFPSHDAGLLTADALSIPFPEGQFKLIICSEVLEHIPEIHAAVREIRRVISEDGTLIVSSPNWFSWFGLFRWVGERIFRKSLHSDDQPYDDWKTLSRYKKELWPEFEVAELRGVWYLPPLHYRGHGIPSWLMKAIYWCYSPFEAILSQLLPSGGHLLILRCRPRLDSQTQPG
jgi:SAM-dependent methyltransferase